MEAIVDTLFRTDGRMARMRYSLWMLGITVAMIVFVAYAAISAVLALTNGGRLPFVSISIAGIAFVLGNWIMWAITVKRLHDIGASGWWMAAIAVFQLGQLGPMVPLPGTAAIGGALQLVAFVASIVVALLPGEAADNQYGPVPA